MYLTKVQNILNTREPKVPEPRGLKNCNEPNSYPSPQFHLFFPKKRNILRNILREKRSRARELVMLQRVKETREEKRGNNS